MRRLPPIKIEKEMRLDVGCANCKKSGYLGIDNVDYGQEILWDIRDGIPLPDNSVDEVYTSHMLEHLTNKENKDLADEVLRVLKPGGIYFNKLPSVTHFGAFYQDHESYWNEPRVVSIARNEARWEMVYNMTIENELHFKLCKK
jgi:predicted SAM-dependent methyltransferase